MTEWTNEEDAGLLPMIFNEYDNRTAQEQANANYSHGGGWMPFKGFTLDGSSEDGFTLHYPEDDPMRELSRASFHDKTLVLFEGSWVAIIEKDGSMSDVSRMD